MFIVEVFAHVKADAVEAFRSATVENGRKSLQEAAVSQNGYSVATTGISGGLDVRKGFYIKGLGDLWISAKNAGGATNFS